MSQSRFVAIVPATALGLWLLILRLYLVQYFSGVLWALIQLFLIPLLLCCVMVFFSNLRLPVTTSFKVAIRLAMPSAFVYLLFSIINDVVVMILDSDFSLETIGFSIINFFVIVVPSGMLLMLGVAFFGWLGTRIKLGGKSKF